MERLRMKNLLLACTIMLGLQFCCPLVLRADDHAPVAELISLGTKDAESEADTLADHALTAPFHVALVMRQQPDDPTGLLLEEDGRVNDPLLPTAGRYPSAP